MRWVSWYGPNCFGSPAEEVGRTATDETGGAIGSAFLAQRRRNFARRDAQTGRSHSADVMKPERADLGDGEQNYQTKTDVKTFIGPHSGNK